MALTLPISQEELKDILIKSGVIKDKDWVDAEKKAQRRRRGVEEILIERGFYNEKYLYEVIGDALKVPYVNLRKRKLDPLALAEIDPQISQAAEAIPFGIDGQNLKVAFVDPRKAESLQMIQQATTKTVLPFMTSHKNFRFASRLYQRNIEEEIYDIINTKIKSGKGETTETDVPIIKIVDAIMEYAMFEQSSDVHIEALPDAVVVRFRVDGDLHDVVELPATIHNALVARIKILSNLRIDEHRVPQDGRFSFKIEEEEESVRVSIIPAFYGEKVVMRLMTDEAQNMNLEDIGFSEQNANIMKKQLEKPFGMILVVGPTGSGKTTTLYAVLNMLNTEEVNICTIEDPIEYGVHRVNQTQVNSQAGYTFASGLRSLLRQDPDVIMIGEIRDKETAQISVRAALTGHLVLSTLHTNNAAGAPPRLLDMDVESFLVSSTLNIVIAQRLVRRICLDCIYSLKLSPEELKNLAKEFDLETMLKRFKTQGLVDEKIKTFAELTFYRGKGCVRCHQSGYSKRVSVLELMQNTEAVQKCIIRNASSNELQKVAMEEGMVTIFEDGMQKALLGVTTIEEVLRIKRE